MKIVNSFLVFTLVIGLFTACDEDDPITPQQEHFEAIGVVLTTSGIQVVSILRGETDDTLHVPLGALSDHLTVSFYNENEQIVDAPSDGDKTLAWEIGDPTITAVHQDSGHDGEFELHMRGLVSGVTTLELFIMHEGHSDFRSGKIPVRVN